MNKSVSSEERAYISRIAFIGLAVAGIGLIVLSGIRVLQFYIEQEQISFQIFFLLATGLLCLYIAKRGFDSQYHS